MAAASTKPDFVRIMHHHPQCTEPTIKRCEWMLPYLFELKIAALLFVKKELSLTASAELSAFGGPTTGDR